MPITLGGFPLLAPTSEIKTWIRDNVPVEKAVPFLDRSWPGGLLATRYIATPSRTRAPRYVEVNTLDYPEGADRFALGFFLASAEIADNVRDAANGPDGLTSESLELQMWAENQLSGEKLITELVVQKIVPLQQISMDDNPDSNNPILLVCVDDRYCWQTTPAPDFAIPYYGESGSVGSGSSGGGNPSWLECIDFCADVLDIDLTVDDIDPAYLSPDLSLNLAGSPIGLVLQALVENIGQKFVRKFDGTCYTQNYATAATTRANDMATNSSRTLRAGGEFFADEL